MLVIFFTFLGQEKQVELSKLNLLVSSQPVWFGTAFATYDNGQEYIFKASTDRSWEFFLFCFTADYELTQLQERLRETEEAMEKLINRVGPTNDRCVSIYRILRRGSTLIKN